MPIMNRSLHPLFTRIVNTTFTVRAHASTLSAIYTTMTTSAAVPIQTVRSVPSLSIHAGTFTTAAFASAFAAGSTNQSAGSIPQPNCLPAQTPSFFSTALGLSAADAAPQVPELMATSIAELLSIIRSSLYSSGLALEDL
ncbi:hypothetical protein BSLG_007421 [Batrachochytrium salamandrivorans]|nr:hypothetical protein BSLG_007421 [Batrachochytrium salamandrivorans]